ncbi:hypothetical protein ACJX0J_036109, partial [Zea mays]
MLHQLQLETQVTHLTLWMRIGFGFVIQHRNIAFFSLVHFCSIIFTIVLIACDTSPLHVTWCISFSTLVVCLYSVATGATTLLSSYIYKGHFHVSFFFEVIQYNASPGLPVQTIWHAHFLCTNESLSICLSGEALCTKYTLL